MNNTFWIGVWPGINEECINYVINKFEEFFAFELHLVKWVDKNKRV